MTIVYSVHPNRKSAEIAYKRIVQKHPTLNEKHLYVSEAGRYGYRLRIDPNIIDAAGNIRRDV